MVQGGPSPLLMLKITRLRLSCWLIIWHIRALSQDNRFVAVCGRVFEQLSWRVKQASPAHGTRTKMKQGTTHKTKTFTVLSTSCSRNHTCLEARRVRCLWAGTCLKRWRLSSRVPDCLQHGLSNCLSMHSQSTSQSSHNLLVILTY